MDQEPHILRQDGIAPLSPQRRSSRRQETSAAPAEASLRNWSVSLARDERNRNAAMWIFVILLARTTLAAPIRAFIPFFWYIPDLFMLVAFGFLLNSGLRFSVLKTGLFVGLLLTLILYALLNNSAVDVLLQTRQIGYLILACLVGMGTRSGSQTLPRVIILLGVTAMVGVYWDYLFKVPWYGAVFSGALQAREVAREWWGAGGVRRLSGFGLSSGDTAAIIGVGCLTACAFLRSKLAGIAICVAAIHTLLLTTQKATAAWLIILVAVFYIPGLLSMRQNAPRRVSVLILKGFALIGLIGCIIVPIAAYGLRLGQIADVNAPTLDQRTAEVWPTIIPYLLSFPQFLLGYGMGAIGGTASNPDLVLCDNMFLFVAMNFGVPIALAVFAAGGVALWKAPARFDRDSYALAIAALLILNGITANVLGSGGVNGSYLGFAIGLLLRPRPRGERRSSRE